MIKRIHIFSLVLLTLAFGACKRVTVDFKYSPTEPRAGQPVYFSNLTSEGETWEWNFGDGSTSSSKSPYKTYKRAGTYTVVLKVDDKNALTCAKTIVVSDTVPTITVSDSIVTYYKEVHLSCSAYNPYNKTCTYAWSLPEECKVLSGNLNSHSLRVCFTRHDAVLPVKCTLTIDTVVSELTTEVAVQDVAAPALKLLGNDATYMLRMFTHGVEAPVRVDPAMELSPEPHEDFNQASYSVNDGNLVRELKDGTSTTLISGGVRMFTLDRIAKKIYYTIDTNLYVATINGEQPVCLATNASAFGLLVDNAQNRLYWTAADGIYTLPLVQTANNATMAQPQLLCPIADVFFLMMYPEPQLCPENK